jgi:ParB-like chromosome segregation protein Spo0J
MASKKFSLTDLLNERSKEEQRTEKKEASAAEGMEFAVIDIDDLIPSKENFYAVDEELKQSIELFGILQPLLVKRDTPGKYMIRAGHRRRMAAIALVEEGKEKYRKVPCMIRKEDALEKLEIIMTNRFREKTDWERMKEAVEAERLVAEIKREYKLPGRTSELLGEIIGISNAQMGRYRAISNNLAPELMEKFKANEIGFSVAAELCGMEIEQQEAAVRKLDESGSLKLSEVKEAKKTRRKQHTRDNRRDLQRAGGKRRV